MNNEQNNINMQYQNVNPAPAMPQRFRLTLNRKRSIVGAAVTLDVNIDNQKVGTIKNGGTLELDVLAGNHIISVSRDSTFVSVNPNNGVNVLINGNTTADVVLFGSNNFGITNINGQGVNSNGSNVVEHFARNKINAVVVFAVSIIISAISTIMFITSKMVIMPWIYGFVAGYAIVNLTGAKAQKGSDGYALVLFMNIMAIIVAAIFGFVTAYISINNIGSLQELFGR